ncbi:unnamed protein product [Heligmosomoides polygyrus]|uniref:CCHC-type domain-containing protein n=1 Tax=Heligmosomoides polygyrus TaxID=6339 RepID=A0A183FR84_HELPZ|nr:unnamed protein product [Heligmosomoides polygyrus]
MPPTSQHQPPTARTASTGGSAAATYSSADHLRSDPYPSVAVRSGAAAPTDHSLWSRTRIGDPMVHRVCFLRENHYSASCRNCPSLERSFQIHSLNGRCFRCTADHLDKDCPRDATPCRYCNQATHHPAFCPVGPVVIWDVPYCA